MDSRKLSLLENLAQKMRAQSIGYFAALEELEAALAQQAQPKMPTREQIATVLCGFREDEAYPAADAVLALLGKSEAKP